MERKVTVKQHALDKTWTDEKGATLRVVCAQSNTFGEKDFKVEAIAELVSPADAPFRKEAVRTTKSISGDDTAGFEDAAGQIVRIMQTRRAIPSTAARPYTEFSTPFVNGITIGSFKQPDKPSVYFFDITSGNGPFRFLIGDQDQLEEFRYFFRQVSSFNEAICQQRGAQAA
jgi:hypothetical protein